MTVDPPQDVVSAFEAHDAYRRDGAWFVLTTTRFDARVTAAGASDERDVRYTLEVRAPMLSAASKDDVPAPVEDGWFRTYERRLEDVTMSLRRDLTLAQRRVFEEADDAVAVFVFAWPDPGAVPEMTKAMAEFVEGTYLEGVVPGYRYRPPVSELLASARSGDDAEDRGPMPL